MIAATGRNASPGQSIFSSVALSVITVNRVASNPVPAVVGTAMIGSAGPELSTEPQILDHPGGRAGADQKRVGHHHGAGQAQVRRHCTDVVHGTATDMHDPGQRDDCCGHGIPRSGQTNSMPPSMSTDCPVM